MSVDVKKMTMKITTDGSGQVCVTNPILLLSLSGIEEKRTLYRLMQKNNFISCYYHYSFEISQWEGCLFEIWKNNMDRQEDLTPCIYGYNFLGLHNLLTSHPMQAFIGKCVLVQHASASSHIVCGSGPRWHQKSWHSWHHYPLKKSRHYIPVCCITHKTRHEAHQSIHEAQVDRR